MTAFENIPWGESETDALTPLSGHPTELHGVEEDEASYESTLASLDSCGRFQLDLSCLIDSELDEAAATRAMLHIESCATCRGFFEEARACVHVHRDVSDPERLLQQISNLTGQDLDRQMLGLDLVHRLAGILYQLGKAYLLTVLQPDKVARVVFEKAVDVEPTRSHGRGFVDGVILSGQDDLGEIDWTRARSMFNGRLEKVKSPLAKAAALLDEAIRADPSHEEARLYSAYLHLNEGKRLQAAEEFRRIFRTAIDPTNRGHAATRLGCLYAGEQNFRKALVCSRWVAMSGLDEEDDRFWCARFNTGMNYAFLGDRKRSLKAFRELLDRHPHRVAEVAEMFDHFVDLQAAIEESEGFLESLFETCPELFHANEGK